MAMFRRAFSLVELSIVIVTVGVVIAAITAGTELQKQAALRSVISDIEILEAAYNTFKSTYDEKPGDMPDATVFFADCMVSQTYCNGNGNDIIEWSNNLPTHVDFDEGARAMRHLNLAGLISNGGEVEIPDFYRTYQDAYVLTKYFYRSANGGSFTFGGNTGDIWFFMTGPFSKARDQVYLVNNDSRPGPDFYLKGTLTGSEAFQIDKKIDDAKVQSGAIGVSTGFFRAVTGQDGGVCTATATTYDTTSGNSGCIVFKALE